MFTLSRIACHALSIHRRLVVRFAACKCTCVAFLAAVLQIAANDATAIGTNAWQGSGGSLNGSWDTAARWSQAAVPGTAGHTDDDVLYTNVGNPFLAGPYTISLSSSMYAGGNLTLRTLQGTGSTALPQYTVGVNGVGTAMVPLNIQLGDTVISPANSLRLTRGGELNLTHANLTFVGSHSGDPIDLAGGDLTVTDTNITVTGTNAGALSGFWIHDNPSVFTMTRGSLTVKNSSNNAEFQISEGAALISDANVDINVVNLLPSGANVSTFTYNGMSKTANIGSLNWQANSKFFFNSGTVNIGSMPTISPPGTTGQTARFVVDGADVTVSGDIIMNSTNSGTPANTVMDITISAGSLEANNMIIGHSAINYPGNSQLNISGIGELKLNGSLTLGHTANATRHGPGTLTMSGGTLQAVGVNLGTNRADGYWNQSGGVATVAGTFNMQRDDSASSGPDDPYGVAQFVVGTGAKLILTGAGFGITGNSSWALDAANWNVSGTIKFDPSAAGTQTLLAFGDDLGMDLAGLDSTNYSINKLDLSELIAGTNILNVAPTGNFSLNDALYIREIVGLDSAEVTSILTSTLNIYYNPLFTPQLNYQNFALSGGGQLLSLLVPPVPEPGSLSLLCLGAAGIACQRRRKHRRG